MDKSLDKLMIEYINLINKFGENSNEALLFLEVHKEKEAIQKLAEAALKLKENFNISTIKINIPDSK